MATADTATGATPVYRIVSRVHINQWMPDLQQAVAGWEVKAYWVSTGSTLPVFIPDSQYTAANVDQAIRHAGAIDEQIHALGG